MGFCFLGIGDCGTKKSTSIGNYITNNVSVSQEINDTVTTGAENVVTQSNMQNMTLAWATDECCSLVIDNPELFKSCLKIVQDSTASGCPGGLSIDQTQNSNATVTSEVHNTVFGQILTKMNTQIADMIKNAVEQANQQDINVISQILGSSTQKTDITNKITTSVHESMTQNFTANTINKILATAVSTQEMNILVCGSLGSGVCEIGQHQLTDVQIASITTAVVNIINKADAVVKITNYVDNNVKQTTSGILGGIADILKALGAAGIAILGAVVGLIILVIVIMIIWKMSKSKSGGQQMSYAPGTMMME